VKETTEWLDVSQEAATEEYSEKQRELEAIANPIMMKVYGAGGGAPGSMPGTGPTPGGFPGGNGGTQGNGTDEPSIEEVD
jgi:heat shock protein 1/8